MPATPLSWAVTAAAVWVAAAALLWWGHLPGSWRRSLALLTSGLGLYFLVQAVGTEGVREAPTLRVFLLGTPYESDQALASASLPYYILTGVCLLFGTAGLAVRDDVARLLARRWYATAVVLALLLTVLRAVLEKVAAPASVTFVLGITWLPPVVGAFFALCLRSEGRGLRALVRALLAYALTVRGFVVVLMMVATRIRLGTHYDVSSMTHVILFGQLRDFAPGSLSQIAWLALVPQLVFWPLLTVAAGMVGAALALVVVMAVGAPRPAEVGAPAANQR